ncbi:MAG: class I SAM-dependent methyltransferase [Flavobacteriaceae bacterium]|nr:class I SAM-dependent methyltransferase [Flavobacteriaceae bacterium]
MIELPEIKTQRIAVKVKTKAEKIIRQHHPWVFESSITKQNADANAGDLVIIFDQKKNNFLALGLYDPYSPIRIKIIQFDKGATINEDWFSEKIRNAYNKRIPLLETDTNSYRLLNGENDNFPGLIADVYKNVLVIKLYSHIWFPYLKTILPLLLKKTGAEVMVMRMSRRLQSTGKNFNLTDGQVISGELDNEVVVFKEYGVNFSANVIHGHKTGYFLDHRENRRKVGLLSQNKKVLDVFSYAGGFSVHALANNAAEVTSIDISAQALEMAKQNAQLNSPSGTHYTLTADAFEALQSLIEKKKKFDLVVIDPPSFAKKEIEIDRALKSYARLAKLGIQLVDKGGILVLASCSSRVLKEEFFETSESAIKSLGFKFTVIEKTEHDVDHPITFPEGAYLKCGYYKVV